MGAFPQAREQARIVRPERRTVKRITAVDDRSASEHCRGGAKEPMAAACPAACSALSSCVRSRPLRSSGPTARFKGVRQSRARQHDRAPGQRAREVLVNYEAALGAIASSFRMVRPANEDVCIRSDRSRKASAAALVQRNVDQVGMIMASQNPR